ncbi:MAG: NADAR family protein [bacterium]
MLASRTDLEAAASRGDPLAFLFFWGHTPRADGQVSSSCLSQWWVSPFTVEGEEFATAEHWMMAGKARLFGDEACRERILAAPTPAEAKKLGRAARGFDGPTWEAHRFALVVDGNRHKFQQHPPLAAFLLATGTRVLVEASPVDAIWGIGLAADAADAQDPRRWRGLNLLGFALMEVRAALRAGLR